MPPRATKMRSLPRLGNSDRVQDAIRLGAELLQGLDLEFYHRVWATDLGVYHARIKAIEFVNMGRVLDAGSGMGQWTLCLSQHNNQVHGIDLSLVRVEAQEAIMRELGATNVEISQQSVEQLGYADRTFDGVFSYSVLYMTDYRKTLREFHRILKPGGRLYICSNGLGWYVHNLITPHNPSPNHDPRQMAISAISNTFVFLTQGRYSSEGELIIPGKMVKAHLESIGFDKVLLAGEGTTRLRKDINVLPFYESHYRGLENVYELLAWRRGSGV